MSEYKTGWVNPRAAIASIGNRKFPSLAAAVEAARPGDVIVLTCPKSGDTYFIDAPNINHQRKY